MTLIKLLLEISWEDHVDKIISYIEDRLDLNIRYIDKDYKFLGEGVWAKVYGIDSIPDKVIRIDADDVMDSNFALLEGEDLSYVVKVYYDTIIEMDRKEVQLTVLEKLEKLNDHEQNELGHLHEYYGMGLYFDRSIWEYSHEASEVRHILEDVYKGIKELDTLGIYPKDIHVGNIMKDPKSGNYKIIDL